MAHLHAPIHLSLIMIVALLVAPGCAPAPANTDQPSPRIEPPPPDTLAPSEPPKEQPVSKRESAPPGDKKEATHLEATAKHEGKTLREWIAALADKDDLNRSRAADAVAKYGPNARAAVPALIALLKNNPTDLSFFPALMAIAAIGPAAGDAVDPLVALLKNKDVNVRKAAAGTLERLGPAAGKAVSPLIAALAAAKRDTEDERDAFRFPIHELGKYDIRAVFAAVRREDLTDVDLGFVIDALGPGDAQAVAGLTEELKNRDHVIFALGGLKRIGPKAAPALPAIRSLLDDKSPEVKKSAAEAIAAINKGNEKDEPKKDGAKKVDPPEDIRTVLDRAGFDPKSDWAFTLAPYVRFGSKQTADKFASGDKFDKIEINKAAQEHRDAVQKKSFRVTGLKYRAVVRNDIETRGLVAELPLPMRVRGDKPFYEDRKRFSGVVAGLHPSELDASKYWFMTKAGTLEACTPAEATFLEKNNGVLYHPERGNTTLILVFKDQLDVLKDMARNAKDYSVEIVFSELSYQRPLAWGYFRRDAYFDADWDCQKLWEDYLLDTKNVRPAYFPTAIGKDEEAKIPELVRARLDSLRVLDKDGKVIGGYNASP